MQTENLTAKEAADEIAAALARAMLYNVLAFGFRPPEEESYARLCSEAGAAALARAAALLDPETESDIAGCCSRLSALDSSCVPTESHRRLFGHTARGGVPPYETEYGAEALFQQPQEMGDLMGFYRAFGLALKADERERPDHVSAECEFVSFLALKEVYALEHQNQAMLEETRKAERLFLRDHLGRFLPGFAKKLMRADEGGLYGRLGALAHDLIGLDARRFGIAVGPENLTLRPPDDGRVPMACGSGECPVMPGVAEVDESE